MKILKTGIVLLFLIISININGQNLIGYKVKEIKQFMKENKKDFSFSNMIYNNTFKYLKYASNNETETILFFLTADSVCKSVRLICDKALMTEKINELNSNCTKAGNNIWSETRKGKKYSIELKEEDWSFNVTYVLID